MCEEQNKTKIRNAIAFFKDMKNNYLRDITVRYRRNGEKQLEDNIEKLEKTLKELEVI